MNQTQNARRVERVPVRLHATLALEPTPPEQAVALNPYTAVYQVLDATASFVGVTPRGASADLFRAIDRLRDVGAPAAHVATAERISVALHKLQVARQRKEQGDEEFYLNEILFWRERWLDCPMQMSAR